jgi:homogentisate phytyltransferase / homogentisate geranylgeranyltransferase
MRRLPGGAGLTTPAARAKNTPLVLRGHARARLPLLPHPPRTAAASLTARTGEDAEDTTRPPRLPGGEAGGPADGPDGGAAAPASAGCLPTASTSAAAPAPTPAPRLLSALATLYRFSRPHTMLGTAISIASVSALALTPSALATEPAALASAAGMALGSALLMNVAIVGVNQCADVAIDAVNKPHLPLPAGDLTMRQAVGICVGCATASLALGVVAGSPALVATLAASLGLGLAYSLDAPGLRWKRHPAAAAACILAVRAVAVQAGFFTHMRAAMAAAGVGVVSGGVTGSAAAPPPALAFAVAAMLAFSLAIAFLKDTPDVAGDAAAGVRTLPVRAGAPAVFSAVAGGLLACYAAAAGWTAAACTTPLTRAVAAGGHAAAGFALTRIVGATDRGDKASLARAYMRLWGLFYAEYLLIPFVR